MSPRLLSQQLFLKRRLYSHSENHFADSWRSHLELIICDSCNSWLFDRFSVVGRCYELVLICHKFLSCVAAETDFQKYRASLTAQDHKHFSTFCIKQGTFYSSQKSDNPLLYQISKLRKLLFNIDLILGRLLNQPNKSKKNSPETCTKDLTHFTIIQGEQFIFGITEMVKVQTFFTSLFRTMSKKEILGADQGRKQLDWRAFYQTPPLWFTDCLRVHL